ncbi:uncharacterized protein PGTG_18326 [Puccinia graminis f. sp. tritici CRL 75-36-700-3]|uniref:Uncharacterized protein n=1 Tax=Puccinia graminis f. sp. tritici (strain CRL 75-36-700-3 / race SCCL) TaxID=418459 RepID=E3L7H6_PUCGT|nr:uncharacterized protein PGTG_18326 [Puccinia graminis f. sp. tritici CRL 75-36-700-3]EFP92501.1 hypothetical protein PGTG_18326 [Puccinia graminis f. sp. tritici CRL 75-36-700-3]
MIVDDTIDQLGTVMGDDNPVDDDDSGNETEDEVKGFPPGTFQVEESDDEEAELNWMDFVGVAAGQINSEPEDLNESADSPLFQREEETIANVRPETSAWYPFVNREYLIGSLLVGYLHKLISRDMYHIIRSVLTLHHLFLPRWEALRMMQRKIREMTNQTIIEEETVFGQPVFGLNAKELIRDDLMNPLVVPHMDFLPEETLGKNVYKSSQSAKWLKHMLPDLRVQMVESNQKHFYTYEPTKLLSSETVIPIFFYTQQTKIFAKCFSPVFKSNQDQSKIQIEFLKTLILMMRISKSSLLNN